MASVVLNIRRGNSGSFSQTHDVPPEGLTLQVLSQWLDGISEAFGIDKTSLIVSGGPEGRVVDWYDEPGFAAIIAAATNENSQQIELVVSAEGPNRPAAAAVGDGGADRGGAVAVVVPKAAQPDLPTNRQHPEHANQRDLERAPTPWDVNGYRLLAAAGAGCLPCIKRLCLDNEGLVNYESLSRAYTPLDWAIHGNHGPAQERAT